MKHTKNLWISLGIIGILLAAGIPILVISLNRLNTVRITRLHNAGVMIEAKNRRIYIDPIILPESYHDYPADAILITHNHTDHCENASLTLLQKKGTLNVFPHNMTEYITAFNGCGVAPGDQFWIGPILITAFYMYTYKTASHPREYNFTSYLIEIDGLSIFHAGDSDLIDEYDELAGRVDVALLPLTPGSQTIENSEIVETVRIFDAKYFIPIHFDEGSDDIFFYVYGSLFVAEECEVIQLQLYNYYEFKL